MQKQQLTDRQIQLINENYKKIVDTLKNLGGLKKGKLTRFSKGLKWQEAASYIPEVTMEFKEELANGKEFHVFVAIRCYLRLIDEYRSLNKSMRKNIANLDTLSKLESESLITKGYIDTDDISKSLQQRGLDSYKILSLRKDENQKSIFFEDKEEGRDKKDFFRDIDREDEILGLKERGNKQLKSSVRKKLLNEYVIPKLENKQAKNLSQIAKETNLTEGRLSQILRDDNFKDLFKSFYGEVDISGRPIIR